MAMSPEERRTLALVRECIELDRYTMTIHFSERMQERALFWTDIQNVIDAPKEVLSDGMDKYNRPKWKIMGEAAGIGEIEIVCAINFVKDESEIEDQSQTVFITLYWED